MLCAEHSKTANPEGVLKISATFGSAYVGDGRDARESNEMNGAKNNRGRAETIAMQRVNKNASRSMVNEPRAWTDFYACSCPALRSPSLSERARALSRTPLRSR